MCQRSDGAAVPGWRKIEPRAGQPRMGTIYRLEGDPVPGVAMSDADWKLKKIEDDKARKKLTAAATSLWNDGVENAPDAVAYIESRGIRVADLPGGVLPRALRCTPHRSDKVKSLDDPELWIQTTGPVLMGACVNAEGKLRGVQRIFLDAEVPGKRRNDPPLDCKLAKGPISGCACRLQRAYPRGVLVISEGIETGLAIAAATKLTVWAVISTSGMRGIELPETDAAPGGAITTVIIAADLDRVDLKMGYRPGSEAARLCESKLRKKHPHLRIAIALPECTLAPGLVDAAGEIVEGKGVDWLDVYAKIGSRAVAASMEKAIAGASGGAASPPGEDVEAGGEEEDRMISANPLERARRALEELFAPEPRVPGRGWRIRRWNGEWWRHNGTRYEVLGDEVFLAKLRPWMNRFWHMKRGSPVPLNPPEKTISELVANLTTDTVVKADGMPVWIKPEFTENGAARFSECDPWDRSIDPQSARDAGLPDPMEVITFANGLMDIQEWIAGRVRIIPHTELLFSATSLPFDCPVEQLEAVATDDDALDAMIGRMCPTWMQFLSQVSGQDPAWEQLLCQFFGYCLTPWTKYEIVLVMSGATRGGKGTIQNGLTSILGSHNVASSDINLLTDKFHLHTLVGKTLCVMPDADVGRNTDAVRAAETLKKISGGDPVYVDRKNIDALSAVRLYCKILIMCNRMPSLPDPSGAIASRFRVLQFEESFAGREDLRFKDPEVMRREAMGRMLWALKGLRILAKREKFEQPESGQQLLDEYRDYSDPLRKFAMDCLRREDNSFVFSDELYKVWKRWCSHNGRDERSHDWFLMQLRTACPWMKRTQRRIDGDQRKWGYEGLMIIDAHPGEERINGGTLPLPPT